VPALTAMVRRRWVDRVGRFDETLLGNEDHDYWLRTALAGGRFTAVDAQLAIYNWHERNMSHRVNFGVQRYKMLAKLAHEFPASRATALAADAARPTTRITPIRRRLRNAIGRRARAVLRRQG